MGVTLPVRQVLNCFLNDAHCIDRRSMNAKPMLTFTSGLVPRAVDRQRRRRRKPVKTPLIPRVKRVNLTERLSQENSGVSQWSGSVKWVSEEIMERFLDFTIFALTFF